MSRMLQQLRARPASACIFALGMLAWLWASTAGAAAPSTAVARPLPRYALVMGNSAYPTMPLDNPVNDARAIAKALRDIGFKVTEVEDASLKGAHDAVRAFGEALKTNGGVGLFYYAGHGVQVKGRNYLIPVDASIRHEDEVPYTSLDAGEVLDKMESAKNPLNIVILDACRDNPFARGSRGLVVGLAQMDAPVGSMVAFATAPGAPASDGTGRNSVYTSALLHHIVEPGVPVEEVFKRVRVEVRKATGGKQIPWENTSLENDFYFVPTAAVMTAPASASSDDPAVLEPRLWDAVANSDKPRDYQVYLDRYPSGPHAQEARGRIATIEAPPAPRSNPAVPTERTGQGFSFSAAEEQMRREANGPSEAYAEALATPCKTPRKRARIALEIGEHYLHSRGASASRAKGAFAAGLADRLRRAGLNAQIGGKADYYLSGAVTSKSGVNRLLRLNEVSLTTALYLSSASGRAVSQVVSRDDSFAGDDVSAVLVDLFRRQADAAAAQIYMDFCRA